jgi:hypothetical protein
MSSMMTPHATPSSGAIAAATVVLVGSDSGRIPATGSAATASNTAPSTSTPSDAACRMRLLHRSAASRRSLIPLANS